VNARSLATVALKTWGIVLVVNALAVLPGTLVASTASPGIDAQAALIRAAQVGSILNVIVTALLGGALVALAGRISNAILPDTAPFALAVTAEESQILAFALVGIVLLVDGLREVAAAVYVLATKPAFDESSNLSYVWARESQSIVRSAVQIVAGALLMFGRHALARGWSRLRGRSVDDESSAM
jgi:hypothetical protein